eukprot:1158489-Pelagomonas_calceolata.AAC.2
MLQTDRAKVTIHPGCSWVHAKSSLKNQMKTYAVAPLRLTCECCCGDTSPQFCLSTVPAARLLQNKCTGL